MYVPKLYLLLRALFSFLTIISIISGIKIYKFENMTPKLFLKIVNFEFYEKMVVSAFTRKKIPAMKMRAIQYKIHTSHYEIFKLFLFLKSLKYNKQYHK